MSALGFKSPADLLDPENPKKQSHDEVDFPMKLTGGMTFITSIWANNYSNSGADQFGGSYREMARLWYDRIIFHTKIW